MIVKNNFFKVRLFLLSIFVAIGFLLIPKISLAATYYVNHTLGTDDVAHGTSVDTGAWRTLKYALTGSRVAKGDTVYVQTGTWSEDQTLTVVSAGNGNPVTVSSYDGEVTITTGTVTQGLFKLVDVDMVFDGINIDNNNVAMPGKFLFGLYSTTAPVHLTFQNGDINGRNSSGYIRCFQYLGTQPHTLTINKANIINGGYVVDVAGTSSAENTLNIYSSVITENYMVFNANATSPSSLTVINNLFARSSGSGGEFYLYPDNSSVEARNNILIGGGAYSDIIWNMAGNFGTDAIANHDIFDVTYNFYYSEDASFTGLDTYNDIIKALTVVPYAPIENWFVDPMVTAMGSDYTLQSGSLVAGRGTSQHPPDGTDINGVTYGTNDVGPYVNPALTELPTLSDDSIAWFGDSIMYGTGASSESTKGLEVFETNTGETLDNYAVGGHMTRYQFWTIDQAIWTGRQSKAIIAIGINDIQAPRSAQTNAQVSDKIIAIFQKLEAAGIEPVYLGISSLAGNPPDNTDVTEVLSSVSTACTTYDWTCGSLLNEFTNNEDWKTEYYDDLTTDVHPNDAGHAVLASLAEYLFYSKHNIGTDEVDIGAGARIFADGKFRDLGTVSGATADFTVTPVGGVGSFDSDDHATYMDVTINTWETTGSQNKEWQASSSTGAGYSHATSTVYTIGDLALNSRYRFTLDGAANTEITGSTCSEGFCWSDGSGELTFTYTGGYSTHTFALTKITGTSVPVSADGVSTVTSTTPTVALGTVSDLTAGETANLTWTTAGTGIDTVALYYSTDSGITYGQIAYNLDYTLETFSWTVPSVDTNTAVVKIVAYDSGKAQLDADVSSVFSIAVGATEASEAMEVGDEYTTTDSEGRTVAVDSGETGASPLTGETEAVSTVVTGEYIRAYGYSTVYYVDENMNRRPFWNATTFFTYSDSWDEVVWVTNATLATLDLGEPMLPAPGTVLVKIQSTPETYTIEAGNVLRWIPDEATAAALYGQTWSNYVIDLEPTVFSKYTIGDSMSVMDTVDTSIMKTREELAALAM